MRIDEFIHRKLWAFNQDHPKFDIRAGQHLGRATQRVSQNLNKVTILIDDQEFDADNLKAQFRNEIPSAFKKNKPVIYESLATDGSIKFALEIIS